MLFSYKYISHQIEKMQQFIDFIFYEVWCKAPGNGQFRVELFDGNPDLKEVMVLFQYGDTKSGDFFYGHVDCIYAHFAALNPAQIDRFKSWYQGNNDIEKACTNDPTSQLVRYADIKLINADLCNELSTFFKRLYPEMLGIAVFREKIGELDDHYRCFMQINASGKCPFCGINDIKGEHYTKREAYDHYLPKARYPFNSINFRNLAPACHECNSSYKLNKDPLRSTTGRRRAFYPYAQSCHSIQVTIDLNASNVDQIVPEDLVLQFGPKELNEEIETWKDVYGIEERYKAQCCSRNGKYWYMQIMDEWKELGRSPTDFMSALAMHTSKSPFADSNFLRKAFLEGCQRVGLLG